MNRSEIKNAAKEKIKGNIWNLLWPFLLISVVGGVLGQIIGPSMTPKITYINGMPQITYNSASPLQYICILVISLALAIVAAGYFKYILDFVRTGKLESKTIIDTVKAKWLDLLIANVLSGIIIGIGFALLFVPGIIAALALAMIDFLIIDKGSKGADSLKESYELMKGHKWEFFVFELSFLGWYLLIPITLGLILIWLAPYVNVANTMYYDKLVSKKN